MKQLSISFTLGKASDPHGANLAHNNREFSAANIAPERTSENIVFACERIQDAYESLFRESLAAYNAKQKQACRRIDDYYAHIANGKREEAFYEVIVQFGDCRSAPCGSENGELAKQMLIEYMQEFQRRNPNLFVFNAVLHMDEASPHLHIDFIPFYTSGRKNSLSSGVSMRAALEEMGFVSLGRYQSPVIGWEESERIAMEQILMRHGLQREDKQAHYAHMTVDEYKRSQDTRRITALLQQSQISMPNDDTMTRNLMRQVAELTAQTRVLEHEKQSPYKSFFYTDTEKRAFVLAELEQRGIPFRETETGFEAQQCYTDDIRKIETQYRPQFQSVRDQVRADIDRFVMMASSFENLLEQLQDAGYEVKRGKYLALRPAGKKNFIRLISLGADYDENALSIRIRTERRFEHQLNEKYAETEKRKAPGYRALSIMRLYIFAVRRGAVIPRRKDASRMLTWTNDAQMDKLLRVYKKIADGATLLSMREDVAVKKQKVETLREQCKPGDDALTLAELELQDAADLLLVAERVHNGTFVQKLVQLEDERKLGDFLPNGTIPADNNTPTYRPLKR